MNSFLSAGIGRFLYGPPGSELRLDTLRLRSVKAREGRYKSPYDLEFESVASSMYNTCSEVFARWFYAVIDSYLTSVHERMEGSAECVAMTVGCPPMHRRDALRQHPLQQRYNERGHCRAHLVALHDAYGPHRRPKGPQCTHPLPPRAAAVRTVYE